LSLAGMLVLGVSTACAGPQQDRGDMEASEAPSASEAVQATAEQFRNEAREALNELRADFDELEASNADLQGESAAAWAQVREEIVQIRQELETDVDRLQTAAAEESHLVRSRITQNFEAMTHRVERAELLATDGNEEFVNEAQERLAEIDANIQSLQSEAAKLPVEAREGASASVENLRTEANDVREAVRSMVEAAPQQIAEQREELAEDVAALSASVRREMLELHADLTS
jgi:hypothetical protein